MIRSSSILILGMFLLISSEKEAFGYTDPGSGVLVWQMLAAGLVGALFYLRKVSHWFKGKKRGRKD